MSAQTNESLAAKRHVVWVCAGCDDCEPVDGSEPTGLPCVDSPSMDGAGVVLAVEYDRAVDAFDEAKGRLLALERSMPLVGGRNEE